MDDQHTNACPGCGVLRFAGPATEPPYAGRCAACVQSERAPQGEAVRLFTPAPAQLQGQEFFALEVEPLPARVTGDLPRPARSGAYYCRHCDTPEAMPGHYC